MGVLACLTNEPANKRAAAGNGTHLPASVARVLARLIDQAPPAPEPTAERCARSDPVVLLRFAYASGPVDVVVAVGCSARAVAYVRDRGYQLSSLLSSYALSAAEPSDAGMAPDVMGDSLTRAVKRAGAAGDTVVLDGELVDAAAPGTVVLQYPTLEHQVTVVAAVHRFPACRAAQLVVQYRPGGAGAGNDFGAILVRNTSRTWCELPGPITLVALGAGRPVTVTVQVGVASDLELSPHARAAVPGDGPAPDQLVASILLRAGYRDDRDGSPCDPHWIVPTTWQLALDSGTLTVGNGRASAVARPTGVGGLITCRGRFASGPAELATS